MVVCFVYGCMFCIWLYVLYMVVCFVYGCMFCIWLYALYMVVCFVYGCRFFLYGCMFCILLFNSVSYVFLLLCLCILIDKCALFCTFFANWHSPATLTEVFPFFSLSCKANARVYLAKTGHGPHSS